METTGKTFEATIPEQSTSATPKTGLDEALGDIKTGRVSKKYTDIDELWKDLTSKTHSDLF